MDTWSARLAGNKEEKCMSRRYLIKERGVFVDRQAFLHVLDRLMERRGIDAQQLSNSIITPAFLDI